MRCLTVLSMLLEYPDDTLWHNKPDLISEIQDSPDLNADQKTRLIHFINHYLSQKLLDCQAEYSMTFDLGSRLSLLLFEHVHGESRERGQAMVELLNDYRRAGLELAVNQLPDYLPLVLEFLSQQTRDVVQHWLFRMGALFRLLSLRLTDQDSQYRLLFDLLTELSQCHDDDSQLQDRVRNEQDDRTPEALDTVWQEEHILFSSRATENKRTEG